MKTLAGHALTVDSGDRKDWSETLRIRSNVVGVTWCYWSISNHLSHMRKNLTSPIKKLLVQLIYLRALAPLAPRPAGVPVLTSYTEEIFLGLHIDLKLSVISHTLLKEGGDIINVIQLNSANTFLW